MSELEQQMNEMIEEQEAIPIPRQRYKSTLGDKDRRKQTAKINIAKGRQVKLDNLKRKKEEEAGEIDIYSESDSESSDDEYVRKKKKHTLGKSNVYKQKIQELEQQLFAMEKKNKAKKKAKGVKKISIQLAQPAAVKQADVSRLSKLLSL